MNAYDFLVGQGFDVHAVEALNGDHVISLCGVSIPTQYRILAHSDGDVMLHALVDAILGTIGAGDIGEHFPPTDARWKNANSLLFLEHAVQLCEKKSATIIHVDITFIGEIPKITPHKINMKKKLAEVLSLPLDRISIKATTTEKLGFLGKKEGIAAQAIVSVKIPA